MLDTLIAYRSQIGQVLGVVGCTFTVICFQAFFGWGMVSSVLVGILAFVSMPIAWAAFVRYLEIRRGT